MHTLALPKSVLCFELSPQRLLALSELAYLIKKKYLGVPWSTSHPQHHCHCYMNGRTGGYMTQFTPNLVTGFAAYGSVSSTVLPATDSTTSGWVPTLMPPHLAVKSWGPSRLSLVL